MLPLDLPLQERQEAINATLVRSEGSPKDISRAVLFLVQSEFVTGIELPVDGGRTIWANGR
jgi:pteridine reductase